jgi:uroporphyrinogen decarboxylase
LIESHKYLFPDYKRPEYMGRYEPLVSVNARVNEPYVDDFGCVWVTSMHGIVGTVQKHPLESWDAFKDFQMPDPMTCTGIGTIHWDEYSARISNTKKEGNRLAVGGLRHGHTFLQLCDLRGYENLLFDMADDEPRLTKLIDMLTEFNLEVVNQMVKSGCEMIQYAEDLGMQKGPMISPSLFRKYIVPSYKRLMQPSIDNHIIIHFHSDGDIRTLVNDILDCQVQVLNLQDNCNGIEWIANHLKGRVCIDLDIDRQSVTRFGTPREIDEYIRREVEALGSKEGGLLMIWGLYPGTDIKNIKAVFDAMEKYSYYFS